MLFVVVLGAQKRALRVEAIELRQKVDWPYVGMVLPTFRAATLNGDSVTIGHSRAGAKQLLYIFDTKCGNCLITLPEWQRAYSALADRGGFEVLGLSIDPLAETVAYAEEHDLAFPIVTLPEQKLTEVLHVSGVPLTVVTDAEGKIEYVRRGSMSTAWPQATDSVIAAAVGAAAVP